PQAGTRNPGAVMRGGVPELWIPGSACSGPGMTASWPETQTQSERVYRPRSGRTAATLGRLARAGQTSQERGGGLTGNEEIVMSGSILERASSAGVMLAGGVFTGFVAAAALASAALAESKDKIPNLASADFGWQSNVADWQAAPAGLGHGPIK